MLHRAYGRPLSRLIVVLVLVSVAFGGCRREPSDPVAPSPPSAREGAAPGTKSPEPNPPPIALLYTDLDGTLLDDESEVPAINRDALRRLQEAGVRVGVATGRMPEAGLDIARSLQPDLPMIFANGAVILRPDGTTLRMNGITDAKIVDAVCERIGAASCQAVYTAYGVPASGKTVVAMGTCAPGSAGQVVVKIRARNCGATHAALDRDLKARYGERYSVIESGTAEYGGVSFAARGVDKADALRFVATELGVPLRQVAFVGDSGNDIGAASMLHREGGRCFAVANATAGLKAACPNLLRVTNVQGAVAHVADELRKIALAQRPRGRRSTR